MLRPADIVHAITLSRQVVAAILASAAWAHACAAADLRPCLGTIRAEAVTAGIAGETFDAATAGIDVDESVLEAMQNQPEFKTPIWDYLAGLVDEQRIADGRARLAQWADVLAQVEQKFGVDRHTVVAVWGIESDFGRIMGTRPLVRSLATVSCFGSRQRFFRGELIATLRIVQSGDIAPEALVGSWAGAFGQTQFMPTTYQRLAVDMDGDGRRDIVASVADALGSTANYLKRAGWTSGAPWGYEVRVPEGYAGPAGRKSKQSLQQWTAYGITRVDGGPLDGQGAAGLLLPAGPRGPAFLVFRNFEAIYSYNAAESYALAIAHLSDRLRGAGPFMTQWPTDDPGISRAERREVQQLLIERGFGLGAPDGIMGPKTQSAIREFQSGAGLPVDGRAGMRLLRALRTSAGTGR